MKREYLRRSSCGVDFEDLVFVMLSAVFMSAIEDSEFIAESPFKKLEGFQLISCLNYLI